VTCPELCEAGACVAAAKPAAPGDLVINELMILPPSGALARQYIELHNTTSSILNLELLSISGLTPDQDIVITEPLLVAPGGFVVLGASDDPLLNGDIEVDYVYANMALSEFVGALSLTFGGVEIDQLLWLIGAFPDDVGAAMSLDPTRGTHETNDYAVGWCSATSALGDGGLGTPGTANDPCVIDYPVQWCRLLGPAALSLDPLGQAQVTGRLLIEGVTHINQAGNDPIPARIRAAVGYGAPGTNPATDSSWTWSAGAPDPDYAAQAPLEAPDEDQYVATLTAPEAGGAYDVAFRFSGDAGATWQVCDANGTSGDGSEPYASADAGKLNVTVLEPPNLVITEYVDGSPGTGNKAVELTNFGDAGVDLGATKCSLRYYATPGSGVGSHTEASFDVALVGTVEPGASWVFCQAQIAIFPAAECDQLTTNTQWFNGDDPVELHCAGVSVDWIGQTGIDVDFALDVTLKRSCDVLTGDPVGVDAFTASDEWLEFSQNTVTDLGRHEPPAPVTVTAAKALVFESIDLVTRRFRLRNVSANAVAVTSAWQLCSWPTYQSFTSSTVSIAAGDSATFTLPSGIAPFGAGAAWELGLYTSASNFGSAANLIDYLEVNGSGFTREPVGVAAGAWTAGQLIGLDPTTDAGFVLVDSGDPAKAASYEPFGFGCSIQ
jgi:hypothetical protein